MWSRIHLWMPQRPPKLTAAHTLPIFLPGVTPWDYVMHGERGTPASEYIHTPQQPIRRNPVLIKSGFQPLTSLPSDTPRYSAEVSLTTPHYWWRLVLYKGSYAQSGTYNIQIVLKISRMS